MGNVIDTTGLTVETLEEVIAKIESGLKDAYGDDINTDSDTPDGQMINIFSQAVIDLSDLLTQIYNTFDPDNALGTVLDQRVAINGIQRQGGTYTIQPIVLTTDRTVSLNGLDSAILSADGTGYTVADDNDNEFLLASSVVLTSGTSSQTFRAKNNGIVLTVPNTITRQITLVNGVTDVNNPAAYTTLGTEEETDAELRLRRQQSVSLASQGYLPSLLAELLNVSGVTYAKVYENTTGVTDGDSIPGHSIWVIVEGGTDANIANAIYTKRNAGCGMTGDETVTVVQADGSTFLIKFDRTQTETLYAKFDATSIDGVTSVATTLLREGLAAAVNLDVNESININDLAALILGIDDNALATNLGFSTDGTTYENVVTPTAKNYRFSLLSTDVSITVI